jgi:uncharacterized protein (DUF1697 family)
MISVWVKSMAFWQHITVAAGGGLLVGNATLRAMSRTPMTRYIALLRGINVGPHKRIAMADLRSLLAGLGYEEVQTLLQSGNAVFTAEGPTEQVARDLEGEIAAKLGVETEVLVRTGEELAGVVERDPLGEVASDPKRYQVSFLSREPDAEVARELAALDFAPERWVLSGREIYAWHPDGIHSSKLAKLLSGPRLGVSATARNWNTVVKLLEIVGES